jgi:pimeloyl-ACP methyl ester carboxylesterase
MPKAKIDDITMYYEVHGDRGTPLVHIGGLAGDARAWQRQIAVYAGRHRVLAFDNRGTGRTDCPDGPYSTKQFARDTVSLMDHVGIDKAHVLGISMGGAIAQEIALGYPDRVKSLVINCSFAKMDRYGARTIENIMGVYEKQGAREAARHFVLYFYPLAYFNEHKAEVDAKEKVLGDSKRPAHAFTASSRACLKHDTRKRLGRIRCPVLVNAGSDDLMCSPSSSREIADGVPGARFKLYRNASHFFLAQHFEKATSDIMRFLAAVDPKG